MAVNLSGIQTRQGAQKRVTNNRDGLIPNRTITQTAPRQQNADMRNATRYQAEAQQLAAVFGAVEDAASDFKRYADGKWQQDEKENAQQGALDGASGEVNEELEAKSRAYRKALSAGRMERESAPIFANLRKEVDALLNDPDQDPNDRPDINDVNELINARVKAMMLDENGERKSFGSPEADLAFLQRMSGLRSQIIAEAEGIITKRLNEDVIEGLSAGLENTLATGAPLDISAFVTQLPPGVDVAAAKATFIERASTYALTIEEENPARAQEIMTQLVNARRTDASGKDLGPLLSTDQKAQIVAQQRQMSNRIEAAQKEQQNEAWDAQYDSVLDRFNRVEGAGPPPTVAEIRKLRAEGKLNAERAHSLINMIEADIASRPSGGGGGGDSSDAGQGIGGSVLKNFLSGRLTYGQASSQLAQLGAAGILTPKEVRAARTNLSGFKGLQDAALKEIKDVIEDDRAVAQRKWRGRISAKKIDEIFDAAYAGVATNARNAGGVRGDPIIAYDNGQGKGVRYWVSRKLEAADRSRR